MVWGHIKLEVKLDGWLKGVVGMGVMRQIAGEDQKHSWLQVNQLRPQAFPWQLFETVRTTWVDQDKSTGVVRLRRFRRGVVAQDINGREISCFAMQGQGLTVTNDHLSPRHGEDLTAVLGRHHLLNQTADAFKYGHGVQALPARSGPGHAVRVQAFMQIQGLVLHLLHDLRREGVRTDVDPRSEQVLDSGSGGSSGSG